MRRAPVMVEALAVVMALTLPAVQASTFGLGVDRLKNFKGQKAGLSRYQGLQPALEDVMERDDIKEEFFGGAVVDNFAAKEQQRYWHSGQRFFWSDKFWGGNGAPIFLMIGGEGPESKRSVSDAWFYYELAREHKALVVCLEHRFYGKSYPTVDMSNSNLQLLTSAQALADLARFTRFFKDKMSAPDSRFIAFGGSYPGNLAAFFKLKYPHLVVGSVASSAPVLAKVDFNEYMTVVGQAFKYFGGEACFEALKEGAEATAKLMEARDVARLKADFDLCGGGIENDKDLWVFQTNVMGNFQGTVQYNAEASGQMTVSDICAKLVPPRGRRHAAVDPYDLFVEVNREYLKSSGASCMDVSWSSSKAALSQDVFDGESAARQWYWQTCNEFGYYQTISGQDNPFASFRAITLQSYLDLCEEIYGIDLLPPVDWVNDYYGGLGIDATNVIYPSGTIDPWHALGVSNTTLLSNSEEAPLYILGTAHCADMRAANGKTDPPSLTYARSIIAKYVSSWVQTGRNPASPPVLLQLAPSSSSSSSKQQLVDYDAMMDEANSLWQALVRSTKGASMPAMLGAGLIAALAVVAMVVAVVRRKAQAKRRAAEEEEERRQMGWLREGLLTSV